MLFVEVWSCSKEFDKRSKGSNQVDEDGHLHVRQFLDEACLDSIDTNVINKFAQRDLGQSLLVSRHMGL